jgi:hypothetical protein
MAICLPVASSDLRRAATPSMKLRGEPGRGRIAQAVTAACVKGVAGWLK